MWRQKIVVFDVGKMFTILCDYPNLSQGPTISGIDSGLPVVVTCNDAARIQVLLGEESLVDTRDDEEIRSFKFKPSPNSAIFALIVPWYSE